MLGIFQLRKREKHWSDQPTSKKKQTYLEISKRKALT
jgi:hypothetical protein